MTSDAGVGLELTVAAAHDVEHMIRAEVWSVVNARAAEAFPTGTIENADTTADLALQRAVNAQSHGACAYIRDGPVDDRL